MKTKTTAPADAIINGFVLEAITAYHKAIDFAAYLAAYVRDAAGSASPADGERLENLSSMANDAAKDAEIRLGDAILLSHGFDPIHHGWERQNLDHVVYEHDGQVYRVAVTEDEFSGDPRPKLVVTPAI